MLTLWRDASQKSLLLHGRWWRRVEALSRKEEEKLSPPCWCPQRKTLDNIIPCILKFTSRVEPGFEKCVFSSFIEERLFFTAEGLSWVSCLRQCLKNMVPCLSKMFWGAIAWFQMRATIMLWRLSWGRMLLSLSLFFYWSWHENGLF